MTAMKTPEAVHLLSALAHDARLSVFRLLIGRPGLSAGDLARALEMPPSSLSFHLKDLRMAGLVESRRDGRQVIYTANFEALTALIAFLAEDCCVGQPELCLPANRPGDTETATMTGANDKVFNVLFLCTGNSARSIMAEAMLKREGLGKFRAFSAGSRPRGMIDPIARQFLERANYPVDGLSSKSWDTFTGPDAPTMDFVFTVCDDAAGEACPVWPGQPMTAHWGVPDPVAFQGSDQDRHLFYSDVYRMLYNRVSIFTHLPIRSLDRLSLQKRLDEIGQATVATTHA